MYSLQMNRVTQAVLSSFYTKFNKLVNKHVSIAVHCLISLVGRVLRTFPLDLR